eukprot:m.342465 g.342465  ORF g.342465 m.342465 type:complete len:1853 (-) comp16123_c0_seq1:83-5641(-)
MDLHLHEVVSATTASTTTLNSHCYRHPQQQATHHRTFGCGEGVAAGDAKSVQEPERSTYRRPRASSFTSRFLALIPPAIDEVDSCDEALDLGNSSMESDSSTTMREGNVLRLAVSSDDTGSKAELIGLNMPGIVHGRTPRKALASTKPSMSTCSKQSRLATLSSQKTRESLDNVSRRDSGHSWSSAHTSRTRSTSSMLSLLDNVQRSQDGTVRFGVDDPDLHGSAYDDYRLFDVAEMPCEGESSTASPAMLSPSHDTPSSSCAPPTTYQHSEERDPVDQLGADLTACKAPAVVDVSTPAPSLMAVHTATPSRCSTPATASATTRTATPATTVAAATSDSSTNTPTSSMHGSSTHPSIYSTAHTTAQSDPQRDSHGCLLPSLGGRATLHVYDFETGEFHAHDVAVDSSSSASTTSTPSTTLLQQMQEQSQSLGQDIASSAAAMAVLHRSDTATVSALSKATPPAAALFVTGGPMPSVPAERDNDQARPVSTQKESNVEGSTKQAAFSALASSVDHHHHHNARRDSRHEESDQEPTNSSVLHSIHAEGYEGSHSEQPMSKAGHDNDHHVFPIPYYEHVMGDALSHYTASDAFSHYTTSDTEANVWSRGGSGRSSVRSGASRSNLLSSRKGSGVLAYAFEEAARCRTGVARQSSFEQHIVEALERSYHRQHSRLQVRPVRDRHHSPSPVKQALCDNSEASDADFTNRATLRHSSSPCLPIGDKLPQHKTEQQGWQTANDNHCSSSQVTATPPTQHADPATGPAPHTTNTTVLTENPTQITSVSDPADAITPVPLSSISSADSMDEELAQALRPHAQAQEGCRRLSTFSTASTIRRPSVLGSLDADGACDRVAVHESSHEWRDESMQHHLESLHKAATQGTQSDASCQVVSLACGVTGDSSDRGRFDAFVVADDHEACVEDDIDTSMDSDEVDAYFHARLYRRRPSSAPEPTTEYHKSIQSKQQHKKLENFLAQCSKDVSSCSDSDGSDSESNVIDIESSVCGDEDSDALGHKEQLQKEDEQSSSGIQQTAKSCDAPCCVDPEVASAEPLGGSFSSMWLKHEGRETGRLSSRHRPSSHSPSCSPRSRHLSHQDHIAAHSSSTAAEASTQRQNSSHGNRRRAPQQAHPRRVSAPTALSSTSRSPSKSPLVRTLKELTDASDMPLVAKQVQSRRTQQHSASSFATHSSFETTVSAFSSMTLADAAVSMIQHTSPTVTAAPSYASSHYSSRCDSFTSATSSTSSSSSSSFFNEVDVLDALSTFSQGGSCTSDVHRSSSLEGTGDSTSTLTPQSRPQPQVTDDALKPRLSPVLLQRHVRMSHSQLAQHMGGATRSATPPRSKSFSQKSSYTADHSLGSLDTEEVLPLSFIARRASESKKKNSRISRQTLSRRSIGSMLEDAPVEAASSVFGLHDTSLTPSTEMKTCTSDMSESKHKTCCATQDNSVFPGQQQQRPLLEQSSACANVFDVKTPTSPHASPQISPQAKQRPSPLATVATSSSTAPSLSSSPSTTVNHPGFVDWFQADEAASSCKDDVKRHFTFHDASEPMKELHDPSGSDSDSPCTAPALSTATLTPKASPSSPSSPLAHRTSPVHVIRLRRRSTHSSSSGLHSRTQSPGTTPTSPSPHGKQEQKQQRQQLARCKTLPLKLHLEHQKRARASSACGYDTGPTSPIPLASPRSFSRPTSSQHSSRPVHWFSSQGDDSAFSPQRRRSSSRCSSRSQSVLASPVASRRSSSVAVTASPPCSVRSSVVLRLDEGRRDLGSIDYDAGPQYSESSPSRQRRLLRFSGESFSSKSDQASRRCSSSSSSVRGNGFLSRTITSPSRLSTCFQTESPTSSLASTPATRPQSGSESEIEFDFG